MKKGRRFWGALLVAALVLVQFPGAEADAASSASAQDTRGKVLGSTRVVGNRAVVLWDPAQSRVYDREKPPVGPPLAEFAARQEGALPKYAVVDGTVIADQAFYQSKELGVVVVPEGIREIGEFAYARSSVTEVLIPAGVQAVGYGAFYHCDSLSGVTFLGPVEDVAANAFAHTLWLEKFFADGGGEGSDFLITGGVLVAYRGEEQTVAVPEGVEVIAAEAFKGHGEITSLTLPESLRVVGEAAFEGCSGLRSIQLNQGLEKIKDRAFSGCKAKRVTVPASVTEEGLLAFDGVSVVYEGEPPKQTYGISATRLSNESYRDVPPDPEAVAAGVVTEGPEGAGAVLEDASRLYTLQISVVSDPVEAGRAFERTFGRGIPDGSVVYQMELKDASDIPISRLGSRTLTVTLPLPEGLEGVPLRLFGLDRNGQLEELALEQDTEESAGRIRFGVKFVSQIVLCPQGEAPGQAD